tara:strand:- start:141 stop:560 length:420 start_codon:yes stop_codon:yes gene_type:complete
MNSFLSLLKSNKKNKESNKKKSYDNRKTLARHRRYCGRGHKVSIYGKYYIQFNSRGGSIKLDNNLKNYLVLKLNNGRWEFEHKFILPSFNEIKLRFGSAEQYNYGLKFSKSVFLDDKNYYGMNAVITRAGYLSCIRFRV